ncbi:MAG: phage minor tail U family protein [Chloroflexota bacterium]|nr:phage minor tail U family protein [Chloroflexota bacterium]
MRDLGHRLLIGLAVLVVAVMAVGYAYIFGGIATPIRGDRATLALPESGTANATILDDGRPVFIVNDPDVGVWVLDAQGRQPQSRLGVAVAWCPETRLFIDPADGSAYAANGELRWGPAEGGLVAFASRAAPDDSSSVIVGSDTSVQGRGPETDGPPETTCPGEPWVVHRPRGDETFDPSVAVDQEPPGWIWLEGTVRVVDDAVRLCDGLAGSCDGYAETIGIDPATFTNGGRGAAGLFIGRVGDDAIEGLIFVPDLVEAS